MRKIFTLQQKIEALELSDLIGPKATSIALGINVNTLKSWRYLRNEILKDDDELKDIEIENEQFRSITFENVKFGTIRAVLLEDKEYWFIGKEIAEMLGHLNASKAIDTHVDKDDKIKSNSIKPQLNNEILLSCGQRGSWLINEAGLYSLILKSKVRHAQKFQRWVTQIVLPSIRRHGAYLDTDVIDELHQNPSRLSELLENMEKLQSRNALLEIENEKNLQKVALVDSFILSEETFLVRELAKILSEKGLEITVGALFRRLKEDEFLIKNQFVDANTPTSKSIDLEVMRYKLALIEDENGAITVKTTVITSKGLLYFLNYYTAFKQCDCCGSFDKNWYMKKTNSGNHCKKCM